jgi:hypothetical protein
MHTVPRSLDVKSSEHILAIVLHTHAHAHARRMSRSIRSPCMHAYIHTVTSSPRVISKYTATSSSHLLREFELHLQLLVPRGGLGFDSLRLHVLRLRLLVRIIEAVVHAVLFVGRPLPVVVRVSVCVCVCVSGCVCTSLYVSHTHVHMHDSSQGLKHKC